MNALDTIPRETPRKPSSQAPLHFKTPHRSRRKKTIQIIYAHLPSIAVLIREQHLRTQTYLEQRAQQLWFDRSGLKNGLIDWLNAERTMAQRLSEALLRGNNREFASNINPG